MDEPCKVCMRQNAMQPAHSKHRPLAEQAT